MKKWTSPKSWLKYIAYFLVVLCILMVTLGALLFWKQDKIVHELINYSNQHYQGKIELKGSHISPFINFPYISIDLEGLKIYETKASEEQPIIALDDAYLGFDLWQILGGDFQLKSIYLKEGYLKFIQHKDGQFNIMRALMPLDTTTDDESAAFQLAIKDINLHNVDIHKINESTGIDVDVFVNDARSALAISGSHTMIDLDARFEMNLIQNNDTTFIKHKHFELNSKVDFDTEKQVIQLAPSKIKLEMGEFNIAGFFDIANEQYLDVKINGTKPNFDLLIAFAPESLIPTLQTYENRGEVYFEGSVKGSIAEGKIPKIDARFGCSKGFIQNNKTRKKIESMEFSGYFKNGPDGGGLETMEFGLQDFNARPEAGQFYGDLVVKNFESPEINLKLRSRFDLSFLTAFMNIRGLTDMSGSVDITMNFHDIIDLQNPEKSIERLNESYFTELEIRDLNFKSDAYYLPINDLNVIGHMEGHQAIIDTLSGRIGASNLSLSGSVSDLPAILHHTDDSVWVNLDVHSDLIDLTALSYDPRSKKVALDEQIKDFELDLAFASSARSFTESPNLPIGEFFIRDLHAQLEHYPHEFHDFHADIFIEDENMRLIDFSGELDRSDFHFSGKLVHYDFWFNDVLNGDTELEFDLTSNHLYLEDILVYKGENYVPEDYQHEDFKGLKFHGRTQLHYKNHILQSIDLYLDQLDCKMQLHQCRFEDFKGSLHYEDEHISTKDLRGSIGRSDFALDMYWYLGKDPKKRKEEHYLHLVSDRLDINQLLEWKAPPSQKTTASVDHDAGFSVFNLPFWDMQLKAEVGQLNYHQYSIKKLDAALRMTSNRYLHIDTCLMTIAGGDFDIQGYFNASDSNEIYFSPRFYAENVDIDKFMVKFDNFGQDYLVSDNLHGRINCGIKGKLHMHKDLTPMLDKSNFEIDLEVVNGRLENYQPVAYLADYFKDKNLNKIRFDTLQNIFKIDNNLLSIPVMTINSSLGFIELWGEQRLDEVSSMDLFFKIPLKIVTKAVFQKLFKKQQEAVDLAQEDAIEYQDKSKKIAYVNVHLVVDDKGYEVTLKKDKDRLRDQRQQRRASRKAEREARRASRRKR